MLTFIRGLFQSILLIAGVLSVIYAVRPDIRRYVETELVARHAYYYVGMVEIGPGGAERFKFLQFYSNRWELSDGSFDEGLRVASEDAFDVFQKLPGETLIAMPTDEGGPMPGRVAAEPLARIDTLALADQCFKVEEALCRYPVADKSGAVEWRVDYGCRTTAQTVRTDTSRTHEVALWVKAARFTCTGRW